MSKTKKPAANGSRRSPAQGRALVEQWQRSGESVSEFCRRESVGPHVLRYWLSREANGSTGENFFVVEAAERRPERGSIDRPSESLGMAGASSGAAVIVVLPDATAGLVAKTVQALLRGRES